MPWVNSSLQDSVLLARRITSLLSPTTMSLRSCSICWCNIWSAVPRSWGCGLECAICTKFRGYQDRICWTEPRLLLSFHCGFYEDCGIIRAIYDNTKIHGLRQGRERCREAGGQGGQGGTTWFQLRNLDLEGLRLHLFLLFEESELSQG